MYCNVKMFTNMHLGDVYICERNNVDLKFMT